MTYYRAENLFRRNAIAALATTLGGRPIAFIPRPWLWIAVLCLLLAAVAILFAWTNEYARKASVRGWLVSEPGVARVTHGASAVVEHVARKVGESVRRGDPILYLSSTTRLGDGASSVQRNLDELRLELAEYAERERLARQRAEREHADLTLQLQGLDDELQTVLTQVREQKLRVELQQDKLARLRAAGSALTELELLRQRDQLAVAQQGLGRLQQEDERLQRERQRLLAAQEGLGMNLDAALSGIRSERSALGQRITAQEQQRLLTLQAPIDGTLATLDIAVGTTIRPQQLLATVLPHDYQLAADLYVPSHAVGLLRPGQEVRLQYDAFPHEQFGTAKGSIDWVGEFVLLPGDLPPTFGMREAAYKARVTLEKRHVVDAAGSYSLRPGMLLFAEIILERHSLADWLLSPLRATE